MADLPLKKEKAVPCGNGSFVVDPDLARMVLRETAAVLLLDADRAFRALVSGFFATAGVFARVRVDHVGDAVIADLENIGADILTDAAPGAKIGIDFGNTHGSPPLGLASEPI
jgi:hypothetical protein